MSASAISRAYQDSPSASAVGVVRKHMKTLEQEKNTGVTCHNVSDLRVKTLLSEYTNLVAEQDAAQIYSDNANKAESRLGYQMKACRSASDLAVKAKSEMLQWNAATQEMPIKEIAQNYLRQLAGIMNGNSFGYYMFGGATSDKPPIANINNFVSDTNIKDGAATSEYTNLIPDSGAIKISPSLELTIGIDATHPAFQKLTAALHLFAGMAHADDKTKAATMFDEAIKGFEQIIAQQGFKDQMVDDAKRELQSMKEQQAERFNTFKANVPALLEKSSQLQQALEMLYASMASKMKGPSLLDRV